MSGERTLLRRLAPLFAVVALLASGAARASSFSPDPPPGSTAKALQPDPAPSAVAPPKPKVTATVTPHVSRAPVVRSVVVPLRTPVVHHTSPAPRSKPKPKATSRPKAKAPPKAKPRPALAVPRLPPVLVPRFIEAPLTSDPPRALAALALALAALTALSGAGVVFSWSRR